ncbi:hypothetical protein ACM66B_006629 [Microbotryomycetes sp. NB124-2]
MTGTGERELPLSGLAPPASQYDTTCYVRGTITSVNTVAVKSVPTLRLQLQSLGDAPQPPVNVMFQGQLALDATAELGNKLGRQVKLYLGGLELHKQKSKGQRDFKSYALCYRTLTKGAVLSKDGDDDDDELFELFAGNSQAIVRTSASPVTQVKREASSATNSKNVRTATPDASDPRPKKQRLSSEQPPQSSVPPHHQPGVKQRDSRSASTESALKTERASQVLTPSRAGNRAEQAATKSERSPEKERGKRGGAKSRKKKTLPPFKIWESFEKRQSMFAAVSEGIVKYEPLANLNLQVTSGKFNLICRATSESTPGGGNGKDYFLTLHLFDATCYDDEGSLIAERCQTCRLFIHDAELLPRFTSKDVLILQNLNYKGSMKTFSGYKPVWRCTVIKADLLAGQEPQAILSQLPTPSRTDKFADVTVTEVRLAKKFYECTKALDTPDGPAEGATGPLLGAAERSSAYVGTSKGPVRPLATVAHLRANEFIDLVAVPLHIHPSPQILRGKEFDGPVSVFVTDWSQNPELFKYTDNVQFPGELGNQRVLQISVYGRANIAAIATLDEGRARPMHFRNICGFESTERFLEARMHEDQKRARQCDVRVIRHGDFQDQIKAIQERAQAVHRAGAEQNASSTVGVAPSSAVAARAASRAMVVTSSQPAGHIKVVDSDSALIKTIASILHASLAKTVGVHTVRAQIVDFSPADLHEWIVAFCSECGASVEPGFVRCTTHDQADVEVYVHAVLHVKDESVSQSVPVHLTLCDPVGSLPGLTLTASDRVRGEDTLAFREFERRWTPLVGKIAKQKRHRKDVSSTDYSPAFTFKVSVEPVEEDGENESDKGERKKVQWFWDETSMKVSSPAA